MSVAALACAEGVADELSAEWALSQSGLSQRLTYTAVAVAPKAWRWTGEMDEIADTFAAAASLTVFTALRARCTSVWGCGQTPEVPLSKRCSTHC